MIHNQTVFVLYIWYEKIDPWKQRQIKTIRTRDLRIILVYCSGFCEISGFTDKNYEGELIQN